MIARLQFHTPAWTLCGFKVRQQALESALHPHNRMDLVLGRKPLTPEERAEPPCTVCLTGAAGYIASTILCRLLACGHRVHATFRPGDDPATLQAIRDLPGASENVEWFQADLTEPGSFDQAVRGCKYVIHTAAPVIMTCPQRLAFSKVVWPTVRGMQNVLAAVNKADSVERVVVTSSTAAVLGDRDERGKGHVFTEEDWTLNFSPDFAYGMSKTLSEWEAWSIYAQQKRWSLVVIIPATVVGPPLAANKLSEGVTSTQDMLNGRLSMFPPIGFLTVDIADVAAAHTIAMIKKEASGRYILCERGALLTENVQWMRQEFPQYSSSPLPLIVLPFWLALIMGWLLGIISPVTLRALYRKTPGISSAKARRELGLDLIPYERSMHDMVARLEALGMVTPRRMKGGPERTPGLAREGKVAASQQLAAAKQHEH